MGNSANSSRVLPVQMHLDRIDEAGMRFNNFLTKTHADVVNNTLRIWPPGREYYVTHVTYAHHGFGNSGFYFTKWGTISTTSYWLRVRNGGFTPNATISIPGFYVRPSEGLEASFGSVPQFTLTLFYYEP